MTSPTSHDEIMAAAERIKATGETRRAPGRDPVNQPMINNWVEAIGDTDPRWQRRRGAAGDGARCGRWAGCTRSATRTTRCTR